LVNFYYICNLRLFVGGITFVLTIMTAFAQSTKPLNIRLLRDGSEIAFFDNVSPALQSNNDSIGYELQRDTVPPRPWMALKTNLLFDALLTPNIEIEIPLGHENRWSIMVEDWFPWFLYRKNAVGQARTEPRIIDKIYKNAYQVWTVGAELRYWYRPRSNKFRQTLTGTFVGLYGAGGKYDWEWDSTGDQGEFFSAGLTWGKAWRLGKHWNLECSGSVGAVWGPRRHYNGEYDDIHLVWKYNSNIFYAGPTKLKVSIAWLIGKGGER